MRSPGVGSGALGFPDAPPHDDAPLTPVPRVSRVSRVFSIAASVAGNGASRILIAGVVVAMFDTGLSANLTSLTPLITLTSLMIVAVYLPIAFAPLCRSRSPRWSVARERDVQRPSRMPLWPIPSLPAIVGIGLARRYQKLSDVIVTAAVVAGGLLCWLAYLPHRDRVA